MLRGKTGIVILNYNSYENTVNCVTSIITYCDESNYFDIYIVDNASTDGSGEKLYKKYISHKNIFPILNSKNSGYARGNNIGIQAALNHGSDYILILNSDILFKNSVSGKLAKFMDSNPLVGVVAPKILTREGTIQVKAIKEPRTFANKMASNNMLRKILPRISKKYGDGSWMNRYNPDKPFQFFEVSGCAWMIRKSVFEKIGLLDENTFLYCEEVIFSHLLKQHNIGVWVYPEAEVIHLGADEDRYQPAFNFICYVNSENYYLTSYLHWNWIQLSCILLVRDLNYVSKINSKDYRSNFKEYCRMRKMVRGYPFGINWKRYN